ncbi:chemotaxis protein CheY [Thermosipho melanesiensis]|uniref:CheC, inhibitor of MCP methylation n=2 Tax=Thermosipho melanesiensis TaxID=46541 RepID=A6LMX9_THEM4|nr:CheY-P phosphatase CheC [Thermosipho melanesiensis]ABR31280.1 CheC, inhibitor of MCP methylation [Thermosipho melanesiensis BI429]APT74360.1 chemotaxis protein CheY [Thermosipho melanesiensis]OOC36303.1 chemotaxis protein CheY [Thermosipho melanesiensis]OOC37121.1 chemotaxis protein CheY [Thermosipho melanesiensis]OOC37873.1 chemotaxis protein CheY [Thermosipho melanesiensis]
MLEKLNEKQLDLLNEIGNIGTGNAATALSMMIGRKVEISVPSTKVVPISNIPFIFENPEEIVCAVKMKMQEDVEGEILLILNSITVKEITKLLTGIELQDITTLDEFSVSMLKEIGNIMCGSYVTALSGFTNFFINPEPPEIAVDMISAILAEVSLQVSKTEDYILLIETSIEIEGIDKMLTGYLLLLPDEQSLKKILEKLGMWN